MSILQALKRIFSRKSAGGTRSGHIKFFDRKKRFGFIIAGKDEYFFHVAATKPADFQALKEGAAVTFIVTQGKKGPQADQIDLD